MSKLSKTKYIAYPAILLTMAVTGCRQDDFGRNNIDAELGSVEFSALVKENGALKTRALDSVYVTSTPYDCNFYIELLTLLPGETDSTSIIGTYKVPGGYQGTLHAIDDGNRLNWQDLESEHTFYAWTLPWINADSDGNGDYFTDGEDGEENPDDDNDTPDQGDDAELYTPDTTPIHITFYNSPEGENGYDKYKNNAVLETFIGTKAGPYSYIKHGKYVDLTFRHLVSKINVSKMTLVKSDGSVNEDVQGDITFIGMPTEAIFYPHPEDGQPPYVKATNISSDNGVTYFINNKANETKVFYICPEIDFSKIGFKINLNDVEYGSYGDYFGSFRDVKFVRNGTEFDASDGSDITTLHAGEMMTVSFELIPGVGPGVSVIIDDWSTKQSSESVHHSHPGIYTEAEAEDFMSVFGNPDATQEQIDNLIELYGEEGSNEFKIYENLTINESYFPMGEEYVLNGMGHQLTMKPATDSSIFNGDPFVTVGPTKDLYITDGTNTIYIDAEGKIWLIDNATGNATDSGYSLGALETGNVGYNIDLVTGEVIQTNTY